MALSPEGRVDRLRERVEYQAGILPAEETSIDDPADEWPGDVPEADAEALIEFSDQLYLLSSDYGGYRHEKLLRHLTILAENVGGVHATLNDRDTTEDIVRWINREYENEETNRDYRIALRVFGRRMSENGDEPPESIEWIPSGTSSTYDPSPEKSNMLDWEEDVLPMIESATNPKQACAIAIQFDAGFRGGEFKDLETGDITDSQYGLQATVQGKQGQRTVTLVPSVPYVRQWLESHPGGADSDPMWCKANDGSTKVSDRAIYNWFDKAAAAADVSKPVTLTNFRKSSASYLASQGMSQAHLEEHHGWVRGSDAASRYIAVFAEESERETARAWGREVEVEDETDEKAPVECPRCDKETPREKDLCVWCGQALDSETGQVVDRLEGVLLDDIEAAESGEEVADRVEILREFKDNPEDRAEILDRMADAL